jgi:hypothetical protein
LRSAPRRSFQLIAQAANMSARWPPWISSSMTCFPIRLESRSSALGRPGPLGSIEEAAMRCFVKLLLASALAAPFAAPAAFAHAFLDHAVPGVARLQVFTKSRLREILALARALPVLRSVMFIISGRLEKHGRPRCDGL